MLCVFEMYMFYLIFLGCSIVCLFVSVRPISWERLEISSEKAMATHSSILAWRIPWTEEPGGLLSMGSHRVGHDCSDLTCMPWRRKWQPPPVFLPGECQGWRSLVGCRLWGRTELGTTEEIQQQQQQQRSLQESWRYQGNISCKDGHDQGNSNDLTEAEEIKKRWQEYTEEL